MSLPAQSFSGITQVIFDALSAKLDASYGIQLTGTSGNVKHSGFELKYDYFPTTQILVLQCMAKPFLIPKDMVIKSIAEHVEEAIQGKL